MAFWADLEELGWSQARLARKLKVTPPTVSAWRENGVPGYAVTFVGLAVQIKRAWADLDADC